MIDATQPAAKRTKATNPRSAAEIIERLSVPNAPGKRTTTASILRHFRTKARLQTSESERGDLVEILGRLDPTWEARATITTRGFPELVPDSTATLAYQLTVAARTISNYPLAGPAESAAMTTWLEALWSRDR